MPNVDGTPVDYARDEAISTSDEQEHPCVENQFMDLFSLLFGQDQHNVDMIRTNVPDDHSWKDMIMPMEMDPNQNPAKHDLKEKPDSFSLASLDILNCYGRGFRMSRDEDEDDNWNNDRSNRIGEHKLSVEEILRVAGERFIQFSTNTIDGISIFIHPYGSALAGLSIDDAKDVELLHSLFDAAEKVGSLRFDLASRRIFDCFRLASDSGSPIQRVSFYFAEALQEKMYIESGRIVSSRKRNQQEKGLALGTNNTFLTTHQELPFAQVMQFAAVQAIIENVKTGQKIHLIDLQIRSGIQWTALMQGLADHAIERLTITSIGTPDQGYVEETGRRLLCFAKSIKFPFSFKVVYLKDMSEFREDLLNIEADETVVVYAYMMLRSMISKPDFLENVMTAIRKLKPALMVVTEVEANHNSPAFSDRFLEALLYYSAFFDCLEDCMERSNEYRKTLESSYFGEGIINIVAAEGEERITRNVKLDVWRAFFARYGMVEMEMSESSKYQASLVLKQFAHGSSCNIECNGKGLVVGWKGTPLHSLTAWKFS